MDRCIWLETFCGKDRLIDMIWDIRLEMIRTGTAAAGLDAGGVSTPGVSEPLGLWTLLRAEYNLLLFNLVLKAVIFSGWFINSSISAAEIALSLAGS